MKRPSQYLFLYFLLLNVFLGYAQPCEQLIFFQVYDENQEIVFLPTDTTSRENPDQREDKFSSKLVSHDGRYTLISPFFASGSLGAIFSTSKKGVVNEVVTGCDTASCLKVTKSYLDGKIDTMYIQIGKLCYPGFLRIDFQSGRYRIEVCTTFVKSNETFLQHPKRKTTNIARKDQSREFYDITPSNWEEVRTTTRSCYCEPCHNDMTFIVYDQGKKIVFPNLSQDLKNMEDDRDPYHRLTYSLYAKKLISEDTNYTISVPNSGELFSAIHRYNVALVGNRSSTCLMISRKNANGRMDRMRIEINKICAYYFFLRIDFQPGFYQFDMCETLKNKQGYPIVQPVTKKYISSPYKKEKLLDITPDTWKNKRKRRGK